MGTIGIRSMSVDNFQLTVLTDAHKTVLKFLETRGLGVMEEIPLPPYTVDIYLPDFHVGIEVDGEDFHNKKQDEKRDKILLADYKLPIYRIKASAVNNPSIWVRELSDFLAFFLSSKDERWEQSEFKLPWI